jgi:hypothetical protein
VEDDKWVHGMCRPEDALGQARLGRDIFFALFGWADKRTKTKEIQGYWLENEDWVKDFFSGGKWRGGRGVRESLHSIVSFLFPL